MPLSDSLDIKGDPYGIDSDKSIVNPKGQQIINPLEGSAGSAEALKPTYFSYKSPVVNCLDPDVVRQVQLSYEKSDVSSTNLLPRRPAFNRIVNILEWFNPAPNICEYKMNIQHVYFDSDYGYYYCVPNQEQISTATAVTFRQTTFSRDDTPSYIVAKWVPNSDYDIAAIVES